MTGEGGSEIAVILLDENGTIVDAHASCVDTFGWDRGELLGKDVRELLQYGRDLLISQLRLLEEDLAGNTSFSVRVLAKRKDGRQFPARATIRRFRELECWTVAFYQTDAESVESQVEPAVSPEEIALAKRALEDGTATALKNKRQKAELQKGEGMSVSRLWRNSRLLFSSRDEKTSEAPDVPVANAPEENLEEEIARESFSMARQMVEVAAPEPQPVPAPVPVEKPISTPAISIPVMAERPPSPVEPKTPAPVPSQIHHARPEPQSPSTDTLAGVARLKAELEKERGERSRIEQRCSSLSSQVQSLHLQLSEGLNLERENSAKVADIERDLRESQEELSQTKTDLDVERRDRISAEEHITILKGLNGRLEETLRLTEAKAKAFETAQQETCDFLTRNQSALRDAEAALDQERVHRQTTEQALAAAVRDQRNFEEATIAERSTLKSLLAIAELERSRSEDQVLRGRAEALDATREARARLGRFRRSFAQVLEHINGTTSELLQSPLSDEQKCVIESLLGDILSLESTLEKEEESEVAARA